MTRLELRGLRLDIAGKPLLRNINLDTPTHELHVILGPSGSGKTTLLKAIAGLHPVARGAIFLDGERIDHLPPERRNIVLLHQEDTLFPHLSVVGNIGFGLKLRGRPRSEIQTRARELLDLVGLAGFEDRRVTTLSGGERQRVALARALAVEPRVLLLDEPFSALDRMLRQSLREDVRGILRRAGVTTLFVTHDRDEALGLADQLILIRGGLVVDRGAPARVFSRPATADAARVLGRRNILPRPGGMLLVNEEDVDVRQAASGSARIEAVDFLGSRTVYKLRRGEETIFAERPGPPTFKVGDAVEPAWDPTQETRFDDEGKTPQS